MWGGKVEERTGEEQRCRVGGGEKATIEGDDRLEAFEHCGSQRLRVKRAMTEPHDFQPGEFC